jgi:hypothetical protein
MPYHDEYQSGPVYIAVAHPKNWERMEDYIVLNVWGGEGELLAGFHEDKSELDRAEIFGLRVNRECRMIEITDPENENQDLSKWYEFLKSECVYLADQRGLDQAEWCVYFYAAQGSINNWQNSFAPVNPSAVTHILKVG